MRRVSAPKLVLTPSPHPTMPRARSLRTITISPRRHTSPGPPSPTFSETTNASAMNFGPDGPEKIITRANLKTSLASYEDLLNKCANYRTALLAMSRATAGFADAMESCATLKGPNYESGTRLQAASGLHHLMGNHYHVLAETLDKQFEKPLRQHLENYRTIVNERSNTYEKALHEKSRIIRQTEMGNMKMKGRNLQTFREALTVLQRQVDDLDALKFQHYQEILEHEEEVWDLVQSKVCLVVRSTLDVFDRFTAKASDPILEPMLQAIPDPFDSYGPPTAEDKIFSILPPLSVIANAPSASASPLTASTPELESSSDGIVSGKSSWTPSAGGFFAESSSAWADVATPVTSMTTPRSVSPPASSPSTSPTGGTLHRRHSHPIASPSTSPYHRKSESKLRSVLAVIDESRSRSSGETEEGSNSRSASEHGPAQSSTSGSAAASASSSFIGDTNGKAAGSEPESVSGSGPGWWGPFRHKLAEPPNIGNEEDNTSTPRTSTFGTLRSPSTPPPIPETHTPPAERSRSPQSDETAVPSS